MKKGYALMTLIVFYFSAHAQSEDTMCELITNKYKEYLYSKNDFRINDVIDSIPASSVIFASSFLRDVHFEDMPYKCPNYWKVLYKGKFAYLIDRDDNLEYHKGDQGYFYTVLQKGDSARMSYVLISDSLLSDIRNKRAKEETVREAKYKTQGIEVVYWKWEYENDYSYAPDIYVGVVNHSLKTIKYIWFYIKPVDAVSERINNYIGTPSLRGIGPIESQESVKYKFERVINSKVVDDIKIDKIVIQYMDKTFKTILGKLLIID